MISSQPYGVYVMTNPQPQEGRFSPKKGDFEGWLWFNPTWPFVGVRVK